jgi:hypothetical protein
MSLTDIGWIIVVWTALAVLVYLAKNSSKTGESEAAAAVDNASLADLRVLEALFTEPVTLRSTNQGHWFHEPVTWRAYR